ISVGFGVRPARERACRRRSPSSFSLIGPELSPLRLLHEDAVAWRVGAVKTIVVCVLILGGGGFHSFAAAGSCLREVEASSVSPSSSPGGEGYHSFASSALGISLRFLGFDFGSGWLFLRVLCVGGWVLSEELSKSDDALRRVDEEKNRDGFDGGAPDSELRRKEVAVMWFRWRFEAETFKSRRLRRVSS
ncbi:LOW QUALITY PROTEIN: hypothetical protein HID58_021984, partial [Brassica napus]